MSVINRMLSELDARQQPLPTTWAFEALSPPVLPPLHAKRRAVSLGLSGAVLITSVAWTDWTAWLPEAEAPAVAQAVVQAPPVLAHATPPTPHRAGATAQAAAPAPRAAAPRGSAAPRAPAASPKPLEASAAAFASAAAHLLQEAPTAAGPVLASAQPSSWSTPHEAPLAETPAPTPAIEKRLVALNPAQRAALAYRQAVELAAAGHGTQAIERAQEALRADADHVPARQLAAALLFEKQRLPEALALLNEGLERRPGQPQWVYLLARLKAETGDNAAALALLAQTAELGADGHGLRAVLLARQGQFAAAASAYEAALRLANDNAAWWVGLGAALEADGQAAQARQAYQRARSTGALNADLQAFVERKLAASN